MTDKKFNIEQNTINEWRGLGFYYDLSVNQWKFFGSKMGLQNFAVLLDQYAANPHNNALLEHKHYGPYSYLKIMTWNKAVITPDYFGGTIQDLKTLGQIISEKINQSNPGEVFSIDKEYGVDNTATAEFFVMNDDFDPVSMDENIPPLARE